MEEKCPDCKGDLDRDLNFPHIPAFKCKKCREVWVKFGLEPLKRLSELREAWK